MRYPGWIASLMGRAYPGLLSFGQRGELAAAQHLRKLGYRILAGGFRTRHGEIDLIALDGRTLVFAEVKTRRGTAGGAPHEAVDVRKQQRIVKSALEYLKRNRLLECRARFDIIGVIWTEQAAVPQLTHYIDAFRPAEFGQFYA